MLDRISWFVKNNLPQTIFFLVFAAAVAPILYYYRRRNPDPRFRPTLGEMTLVSVFALLLCGVAAAGLGTLFNKEHQLTKMGQEAPEEYKFTHEGRKAAKGGEEEEPKSGSGKDEEFQEHLLQQRSK